MAFNFLTQLKNLFKTRTKTHPYPFCYIYNADETFRTETAHAKLLRVSLYMCNGVRTNNNGEKGNA